MPFMVNSRTLMAAIRNILLVDNQDSFTYNLVELVRELGGYHTTVLPTTEVQTAHLHAAEAVILSPGPGMPQEHPACFRLLDALPPATRLLGVCLGHQILGLHSGAALEHLPCPRHGMQAEAWPDGASPLFRGLPPPFPIGLYHSWQLSSSSIPPCLSVTARNRDGQILAIGHRQLPRYGIQFHPESILTPHGAAIMRNFLEIPL